MSPEELHKRCRAAQLRSDLPDAALSTIETYFELRNRWRRTHNIAGPKAMRDPWTVDFIDAVAVWQAMDPLLPLVDVGTGSGTPGILVGCLAPKHPILLVEPIAKRCAFLRQACHYLGLSNTLVERGHWPCETPFKAIQVVSRAVVSPEHWPELAVSGGESVSSVLRMLAAQRPQMEMHGFKNGAVVDYIMPDGSRRCIERWDSA